MEIDSSEPDADDDFGCDHRSLDVLAPEAAYPIDDAEPAAPYSETLSLPPAFTPSESRNVPPEDGPSNSCDPAELNTFGLGPELIAPAETAIPTQHPLLTSDDDFQSLLNYDGESSELASPAITTMPSNASGVPAMDTLDRGSMLPTISTAESGCLAVSLQDHPDGIMDESGHPLHYDPSLSAETYENATVDVAQPSLYSMYPTTMPMRTTESEISALALDVSTVPDVSHHTPHPTPIGLSPSHIAPYGSAQAGRAQRPISAGLPHRGYAPIRPKQAATSPSIATPSTRKAQDTYASSEGALVPYSGTTATKGTKKRLRSPEMNDSFPFIPCKFEPERNAIVAQVMLPGRPSNKRQKETMARKACLRCQFHKKKCSGTFPCECCLAFFQTRTANYQRNMLQWSACIDSDIMSHNFFLQNELVLCWMGDPVASGAGILLTDKEANLILERVKPASMRYMAIFRRQARRKDVFDDLHGYLCSEMNPRLDNRSHLFQTMPLLSRGRFQLILDRLGMRLSTDQEGLSLAWIFATAMLVPGYLLDLGDLEDRELQLFEVWICQKFYNETQDLISKAKHSNGQHRSNLIENLMTLYCIVTCHTVQARFIDRLAFLVQQSMSHPYLIAAHNEMVVAHRKERSSLELCWYSKRFPASVEIVFRHRLLIKYRMKHSNALERVTKFIAAAYFGVDFSMTEAWDHLQDFIKFWLEKLGRGHKDYDTFLTNMLILNTLSPSFKGLEVDPDIHKVQFEEKRDSFRLLLQGYLRFTLRLDRLYTNTMNSTRGLIILDLGGPKVQDMLLENL